MYMDHKPLVQALTKQADLWSPRQQQQHLSYISEFSTDLRHIAGKDNAIADGFLRSFSLAEITWDINSMDPNKLAESQANDTTLEVPKNSCLQLQQVPFGPNLMLWCDSSSNTPRPYLPPKWGKDTFNQLHQLVHPSVRSSRRMVSNRFVWLGLAKDVMSWARACTQCQRAKAQRHTTAPLQNFSLPDRHFQHVHVDIVGPLPISEGYSYLFTMVDHFTHWPEAVPMKNNATTACVQALTHSWIARFGIPDTITSDRGVQFTRQLCRQISQYLGFWHHHSTAYHPQANGLVERLHR